jgi:hypothetical protein
MDTPKRKAVISIFWMHKCNWRSVAVHNHKKEVAHVRLFPHRLGNDTFIYRGGKLSHLAAYDMQKILTKIQAKDTYLSFTPSPFQISFISYLSSFISLTPLAFFVSMFALR